MKLLIICASLEPGRDGVGDYCRQLSLALSAKGINVLCVAINDRFFIDPSENQASPEAPNTGYEKVIRFSHKESWLRRATKFHKIVTDFAPEWISLQYVGFGYSKKGLPLFLAVLLYHTTKDIKFHIMFHELWCGMSFLRSPKERFLGFIQKIFIIALIGILRPDRIFTNVSAYQSKLLNIGCIADKVPVFGNIPINAASGKDTPSLPEWNRVRDNRDEYILLGIFGTVYPLKGLDHILACAKLLADQSNRKLAILIVGAARGPGIHLLKTELGNSLILESGFIGEAEVDLLLKEADAGICTTPVDGVEKSGTAVAWLERGIPLLISPSDTMFHPDLMEAQGLFQIKTPEDICKALGSRKLFKTQNRLEYAAGQYYTLFGTPLI